MILLDQVFLHPGENKGSSKDKRKGAKNRQIRKEHLLVRGVRVLACHVGK